MSSLSDWAARFGKNILLYGLESKNEITGLYKTIEKYGNGVPCYYYTSPVYHVWVNDKWILSTQNYAEAFKCYTDRLEKTK